MLFYAFAKTHQYAFKILLNYQYYNVNKKKDQLHAYKPQRCIKVCLYVFIFTKKVFQSTFRVYKKKVLSRTIMLRVSDTGWRCKTSNTRRLQNANFFISKYTHWSTSKPCKLFGSPSNLINSPPNDTYAALKKYK